MIKASPLILVLLFSICLPAFSQEDDLLKDLQSEDVITEQVTATFKTTRLINAHTNETVAGNALDFRVDHKFGDIAGDAGGWGTFYGFDNATDIRIGFEYGITSDFTAGIGRSKGSTESAVRNIIDGFLKYRLLKQSADDKMPFAVTLFTNTALSTMKRIDDSLSEASFPKFAHRFSYTTQLIIARKFTSGLSLQLLPTYLHRNFVKAGDKNSLFAIGIGGRAKLTKRFAFIADYFYSFDEGRATGEKYYFPLGAGFEVETGGHVFHLVFTNATGILENQYLADTNSSWRDGAFRFAFKISRVFAI